MAKKKEKDEPKAKSKKGKKTLTRSKLRASASPDSKELILEMHLEDASDKDYLEYGTSVIEDRAIFGDDGLKPVARRSLWAAHLMGLNSNSKPDKAAKVVGEAMGNYHPHGDSAIYGAIVTMAKSPTRLVDGEGNWGSMSDGPAAMRYTNMRLSQFSDLVFFDKFYLPTISYVPNYDGSRKEPLVLPALLPNSLINGNFGIAPGVNTRSPSFTLKSLFPVLQKALESKKPCTAEMCMDLVFRTKYGGKVKRTKANKAERLVFYKTGKGRFRFVSTATEVDAKSNSIRIDEWAPITSMEKTIKAVESITGVSSTLADGHKDDKHEYAYKIFFSKSVKGDKLEALVKKVMLKFSTNQTFSVQTTDRYVDEKGNGRAKLRPTTVPELVDKWIVDRLALEQKACQFWIQKRIPEIADLNLLRLAVKMRDFIIASLKEKEKLSDEDLAKYIAKGLKITVEQANRILDLKIRQLRKLEDEKLVAKIKELEADVKTYEGRIKNPRKFVLKDLARLEKLCYKLPLKPQFK